MDDPIIPKRSGPPLSLVLILGAMIVGVVVLVALLVGGNDDSDGAGVGLGGAVGEQQAEAGSTTTSEEVTVITPASTDTTESDVSGDVDLRELPDLPPPEIPTESSPPTTAPGTEMREWPIGFPADEPGNSIPLYGDIVVDLEPDGYLDFPVRLEEGTTMALISGADDGIFTHIEVFRPDGQSEGSWQGGEPDVVNGLEWVSEDERIPMSGTYVVRVVHLGGNHDPFLLRFYGR
jgi:hypothetical protein